MTVLGGCQLHELSMEAVADAAGVGKPVLYTAFSHPRRTGVGLA